MEITEGYSPGDAPRAATVAAWAASVRANEPLGVRLNNPMNIERGAHHGRNDVAWRGLAPRPLHARFVTFAEPVYGFRAAARIIANYRKRGLVSALQTCETWAPAPENEPERYALLVCGFMYRYHNLSVSVLSPLDTRHLPALLMAMARVECGHAHPFLNEMGEDGWLLAADKSIRGLHRPSIEEWHHEGFETRARVE